MGRHFTATKFKFFILSFMDFHNEDQEKRLENKNLLVRSVGGTNVQAYNIDILDINGSIPTSIDE